MTQAILRQLLRIDDAPVRRRWLIRQLRESAPAEAYALLVSMVESVPESDAAREAYLVFIECLDELLADYAWVQALYDVTVDRRDELFRQGLLLTRASRQIGDDEVEEDRNRLTRTLGERKAQARVLRGEALEALIRDPDLPVIEMLLDNPSMTLAVVRRICTRRPNYATHIRAILSRHRWIRNREIQVSLARNPYTPTGIAILLLPLVLPSTLRDMSHDGTLATELCEVAASRYRWLQQIQRAEEAH